MYATDVERWEAETRRDGLHWLIIFIVMACLGFGISHALETFHKSGDRVVELEYYPATRQPVEKAETDKVSKDGDSWSLRPVAGKPLTVYLRIDANGDISGMWSTPLKESDSFGSTR